MLAEGKLDEAVASYRQATLQHPDDAYAHLNLGFGLNEQEHFEAAADSLRTAIALDPGLYDAHYLLGQALAFRGLFEEAVGSFRQAVALNADFEIGHRDLGRALEHLKQPEAALQAYRKAILVKPDFADAMLELLRLLLEQSQFGEALIWAERLVTLEPNMAGAKVLRARALHGLNRGGQALEVLDGVLVEDPHDVRALHVRGNVLFAARRFDEALLAFEQALALKPTFVDALSSSAVVLQQLGQGDRAIRHLRRALELAPAHLHALETLASVLVQNGEGRESLEVLAQALKLYPDDADLHWSKANIELLLGELASGWKEYEYRWSAKNLGTQIPRASFSQPQWTGQEALAGKTIYIVHEQGFGDGIQFIRYLPLLYQKGAAKVYYSVPRPLVTLLAGFAPECQLLREGDELPPFDFYCSIMSLPMAFGTTLTTIPAPVPYLHSELGLRTTWEARLGPRSGLRIGLVWSGSATHKNDSNRSISLARILAGAPAGCQLVSLQKEYRAHDQATLDTHPEVLHFESELRSFADTAALIDCMDLVISVDTSVAHLAGALGRPLWVLLPYHPDWRWMLHRDDSPWYPTARLFRQTARGDWDGVLQRMTTELRTFTPPTPP